jgi:hypothetical protein
MSTCIVSNSGNKTGADENSCVNCFDKVDIKFINVLSDFVAVLSQRAFY